MTYILTFLLGIIVGGVGIMVIAVMLAKGRDEEEPEQTHYCKDCIYPVPDGGDGSYWCEKENCEVWSFTEGCENYTRGCR